MLNEAEDKTKGQPAELVTVNLEKGSLIWMEGTYSCMGRDAGNWCNPFRVVEVVANGEIKLLDFDKGDTSVWTLKVLSINKCRQSSPKEVKRWLEVRLTSAQKNLLASKHALEDAQEAVDNLQLFIDTIDK